MQSQKSDIDYPLVNIQKAIEIGPVEIVDLPMNSMVIFHNCVCLQGILLGSFMFFSHVFF